MGKPKNRLGAWISAFVLGGIHIACSATNGSTASTSSGAGGASSSASASGGGAGVGGFGVGSGGCPSHCSSDLHSVLDCNGNVILKCPPDQGCGGNGCIPACESARVNKSTIGCDYYSMVPDTTYSAGACFAAFVANTWTSPITLTVERGGKTLNAASFARVPSGSGAAITYTPLPNGELPPGEVAILFLNQFGPEQLYRPKCPAGITPGVTSEDAAAHGTSIGQAFHITSSAPVVAYDIFPYGGGISAITSATLLIPTPAWDTNYMGINGYPKAQFPNTESQPSMAVVAAEDGTTVTISPSADVVGGPGVAATGKGVPKTYTLNRGQVLQFTQDAELTGTPIQSNKPVGHWGGSTCMDVEVTEYACDSAHQQIPPIKALGHEYVAVRYRNRIDGKEESPPWRVLGAVDGTTLSYDPAPPGAPSALASGQLAKFSTGTPFVIRSQDDKHPFYISGHMTGGGAYNQIGDPEFVNLVPPAQWLSSYVFFTDPTYPETNLVVIRKKAGSGFADVTLDCAGVLSGWAPVDGAGQYEFVRVDLVRHDFQKQGSCDNGRHEITSKAPFGLTVWGWGSSETGAFNTTDVSYAYPAGAAVQPINDVVVLPVPK